MSWQVRATASAASAPNSAARPRSSVCWMTMTGPSLTPMPTAVMVAAAAAVAIARAATRRADLMDEQRHRYRNHRRSSSPSQAQPLQPRRRCLPTCLLLQRLQLPCHTPPRCLDQLCPRHFPDRFESVSRQKASRSQVEPAFRLRLGACRCCDRHRRHRPSCQRVNRQAVSHCRRQQR